MFGTEMKIIRVLHIIKTLGLGGAEVNLYNLVRASAGLNLEIHVAYSEGGAFEQTFKELDVHLFKYSDKSHKVRSWASFFIIFRIVGYLIRNRIQVIHTHNYNAHVWGAIAAKLAGVIIVEHVHDFRYEEPSYLLERGVSPSQFKQNGCFSRLSDNIIVLTDSNRDYLIRHKFVPPEKITLMRNGIPLNGRGEAPGVKRVREKLQIGSDRRIILSAGRLSKEKNNLFLLDIAELVRKKHRDALFLIAGDGPERRTLEAQIADRKLENEVLMIGFYPDIMELLSMSEICVLPTLLELHSITMLQAMSMGVPALVSRDVGCNSQFIKHAENGYLLDPSAPSEWASVVCELLCHPDLARKIGKAGRDLVVRECDIKNTAAATKSLYEGILIK